MMFTNSKVGPAAIAAMAVCCLGIAGNSHAIVVGDDPALHELRPDSEFAGVGMLSSAGRTSATLIDPWHILTAGHCVYNVTDHTFSLDLADGRLTLPLAKAYKHPSIDLAVVRLASPAPLEGYGLYTGRDEAGQVAAVLGYGVSGTGRPQPTLYPKGTLRLGWNRIDTAGTNSLVYTFNAPSHPNSLGTDKEALPADGDSGGPTMLQADGQWLIAGVHYGITDMDGDGIAPEYGDRCLDIRVSSYVDWIENILDGFVAMPGDVNLDGVVDLSDYAILKENFGMKGALWSDGDFNGDGVVDLHDFAALKNNFGLTAAQWQGAASVPEPTTALLLATGALGIAGMRKRR